MPKKQNLEKQTITETLFRFYEYHLYDMKGNDAGIATDEQLNGKNREGLDVDEVKCSYDFGISDYYMNLEKILPHLNKVYNDNKNKYTNIKLDFPDRDYGDLYVVTGERLETDKEHKYRLQSYIAKEKAKEARKLEKLALQEKKQQVKNKMYAALTDEEKELLKKK